ncbi:MAG TPA: Uma2 family endonuclease [Geminicoccaceae bacterium]
MAKALDDLPGRMTVEEFLEWLDRWPDDPAFELIEGVPVAMAPGRAIHARLKAEIWLALREGIRAAELQCEAFIDGIGIRVDEWSVYQPDVMVHCGERVDDESRLVPEPIIVVEVLSPTTQHVDTGRKLEGYFRVPSIVHYLIAPTDRRVVIHHRRADDERIETRIVTSGPLELDPPGISLDVERLYG